VLGELAKIMEPFIFPFRFFVKLLRPCLLVGLFGAAVNAHSAVHALLIGVGDYQEAKLRDLHGPRNDVVLMEKILIERFAVPKKNIVPLHNPTHTALEKAFADLAKQVRSGDQVYIHYAGHGSWAKAPAKAAEEEADRGGQDQTWVVHGSRSKRREGMDAMDVLDKEIALWLEPLYRVTPDVVFVSDSCHAASVSRDIQTGARSTDGLDKPHPLRATIKRVPLPTTGLRIGAARDFESAVELDPRSGGPCSDQKNCYGVFTWHWASALQSSRPGESWGDVFNRAAAAIVAKPGVLQRPQMEGVADRAVFAGQFAPLSSLVPVTDVQPDGIAILGAGRLFGLTIGSVFEGAPTPSGPAPRLQITSVTAGSAQAKLLNGKVKAGEVVREVSHQYGTNPIRLFVGGPDVGSRDAGLVKQVRQSIEEGRKFSLQGFELVTKREQADWRLEIIRPRPGTQANSGTALPQVATCQPEPCGPPELWVVSTLGQLMDEKMRFSMDNPQAEMPRLLANLTQLANARELRALGAQGNDTPLQVQVKVLRPPQGNTDSCLVGVKENSRWQSSGPMLLSRLSSKDVQLNDCLAFTLVNRDLAKHWYGYILGVDPKFGVQPVWPRRGAMQDEARVEPNTTYPLTKSLYRLSDIGRETLMFVASERPAPVASLSSQTGLRSARMHIDVSSPFARLPSALTRGGVESEIGTWGAQFRDLDLTKPEGRSQSAKRGIR